MPDVTKYDQLGKLAREINAGHEATQKLISEAIVKSGAIAEAILCGQKLIEVKRIVGHGKFKTWCDKHLKFGKSSRVAYMSLADNAAKITGASSIREALKLIADGRKPSDQLASSAGNLELEVVRPFFDFSKIHLRKHVERKPVAEWADVDRVAFNEWYDAEIAPIVAIRAKLNCAAEQAVASLPENARNCVQAQQAA